MRSVLPTSFVAVMILVISNGGRAQGPDLASAPKAAHSTTEEEMDALQKNVGALQAQLTANQAANPQDEKVKQQVEILQKQIETQQKMIQLLLDQMKKQPSGAAPGQALQTQVTTLQSRSVQAANRDQELSQAIDNINEQMDALEQNGPRLPGPLKELFFPSGTNESPLSIYTNFAYNYTALEHTPGGFNFEEFAPHLRLKLNDWIYMIGEIDVGSNGSVDVSDAEINFIVNDWLTVVAGRFPAPIGWFNERLNSPWINKLPDNPLLWLQVLPPVSFMGAMVRGGVYLCDSPVKFEYAAYITNGLNLGSNTAPTVNDLANLENMQDTYTSITNELTYGGRFGLWVPAIGVAGGISLLSNGDYVAGFEDAIKLWAIDLNYHKKDWDFRFEYGKTYQHAQSFQADNIRRWGLYAQLAYRPYNAPRYLNNFEGVFRYSHVNFSGIDPTTLDLSTFASPIDVPVKRDQYEFGLNYYFYASLVLKAAYEINNEPGFQLHDNQFVMQLAWGF